ncbi:MAG: MlaD family protein [Candidatus Cloacimonetes bacterium]|nr:MlaD family protein [Candidatus Cloacimonadota bacterium]
MQFFDKKDEYQIKVGLFSLLAFLILIIGYSWLRDILPLKQFTVLTVNFPTAAGLEPGDSVAISGLEKGRVMKIDLSESGVLVSMRVVLPYPLKEDTGFLIEETDLMGHKQINIIPGTSSKLLKTNEVHSGQLSPGFAVLLKQVGSIAEEVQLLLTEIREVQLVTQIDKMIDSTSVLIENAGTYLSGNSEQLNRMLVKGNLVVEKIERFISDNESSFSGAVNSTESVIRNADETITEMKDALSEFKSVVNKMNREDGSLQLLLSDKELYENIRNASGRLDSLLTDIKKNPKKYFTIKVF